MAWAADGITNGSPILYLGVNVGQIRRVELTADQPGVTLYGTIEGMAVRDARIGAPREGMPRPPRGATPRRDRALRRVRR